MTKSVIIAQCVAIITAIEAGTQQVKTGAIMKIGNATIEYQLPDDQPHQFEVGQKYEVSFFPAAEEPAAAPSTESSDAPNVDGVPKDAVVEVDENLKEAA